MGGNYGSSIGDFLSGSSLGDISVSSGAPPPGFHPAEKPQAQPPAQVIPEPIVLIQKQPKKDSVYIIPKLTASNPFTWR